MKTAAMKLMPMPRSSRRPVPRAARYEMKKTITAKAQGLMPSISPATIMVDSVSVSNHFPSRSKAAERSESLTTQGGGSPSLAAPASLNTAPSVISCSVRHFPARKRRGRLPRA